MMLKTNLPFASAATFRQKMFETFQIIFQYFIEDSLLKLSFTPFLKLTRYSVRSRVSTLYNLTPSYINGLFLMVRLITLGLFIVYIEGSQIIIFKLNCISLSEDFLRLSIHCRP